ncbi:response regulator transcription factor [Pelobium sp.]|nr:response regulator transcription factor [Pelobium sp.]MDA9555524.1 response regulator transcription factor [Pelobium sp.]
MKNKRISVALVDDHTMFRQGILNILTESGEVDILFEADNGQVMIQKIAQTGIPDVFLMDINMPVMDGYESTQWLKRNYPESKILALSMFDEEVAVLGMLRNGAGGYLIKHSKASELIHAIKEIYEHHYFFNDVVSMKLLKNLQVPTTLSEKKSTLNANELSFLELCASDFTYKEIADQMNLSPSTINNYREALFERFNVKTRTSLVIYALKNKFITL